MEQILNEYQVRDTMITGLPVFNEEGAWVGSRDARDGDILTDADLVGVDVERLLRLGSIALVNEPSVPSPQGHPVEMTEREVLEAMTKATLAGIAQVDGIEVKGLNKASIVDAILKARAEAEAQAEADRLVAEAENQGGTEDTEADPREELILQTDEVIIELATAAGISTEGVSREDLIEGILQAWDAAAQEAAATALEEAAAEVSENLEG